MSIAKQILAAMGVMPGVVARRLRRGPEQPGWSLPYELLVASARQMWRESTSLDERRRALDDVGSLELKRKRASFEHTEIAGRPALWTIPAGQCDDGVVLYLHGGAYVIGSPRSHMPITAGIAAAARIRVLSLDYRLAPEHSCPAAIEDAADAFEALVASGVDRSLIVIAGDSAGGGLAVATLSALKARGGVLPAAGVLLSPWTDLSVTGTETDAPSDYLMRDHISEDALAYAGELPLDDPRVSPIGADLTGLPPLYIVAGGAETLRSDSERLAERARRAGVSCRLHVEPGEVHVYPYFELVNPRATAANRLIGAWIRQQLGLRASIG